MAKAADFNLKTPAFKNIATEKKLPYRNTKVSARDNMIGSALQTRNEQQIAKNRKVENEPMFKQLAAGAASGAKPGGMSSGKVFNGSTAQSVTQSKKSNTAYQSVSKNGSTASGNTSRQKTMVGKVQSGKKGLGNSTAQSVTQSKPSSKKSLGNGTSQSVTQSKSSSKKSLGNSTAQSVMKSKSSSIVKQPSTSSGSSKSSSSKKSSQSISTKAGNTKQGKIQKRNKP